MEVPKLAETLAETCAWPPETLSPSDSLKYICQDATDLKLLCMAKRPVAAMLVVETVVLRHSVQVKNLTVENLAAIPKI